MERLQAGTQERSQVRLFPNQLSVVLDDGKNTWYDHNFKIKLIKTPSVLYDMNNQTPTKYEFYAGNATTVTIKIRAYDGTQIGNWTEIATFSLTEDIPEYDTSTTNATLNPLSYNHSTHMILSTSNQLDHFSQSIAPSSYAQFAYFLETVPCVVFYPYGGDGGISGLETDEKGGFNHGLVLPIESFTKVTFRQGYFEREDIEPVLQNYLQQYQNSSDTIIRTLGNFLNQNFYLTSSAPLVYTDKITNFSIQGANGKQINFHVKVGQ